MLEIKKKKNIHKGPKCGYALLVMVTRLISEDTLLHCLVRPRSLVNIFH